jgi:hypothetical protein
MKRRCSPKKAGASATPASAALTRATHAAPRRARKLPLLGAHPVEAATATPKSPWNPKFDHFTKLI